MLTSEDYEAACSYAYELGYAGMKMSRGEFLEEYPNMSIKDWTDMVYMHLKGQGEVPIAY